MADATTAVKESFERLNKLTIFALTTLLTVGYAFLHHDSVVIVEKFTIDTQFLGTIIYLLLACVNFYIAAALQSARALLLVAEKKARKEREKDSESVPPEAPAESWRDPDVVFHPRESLVEELREEFRQNPWLCNPYSETGPGLGRVTDCLGIIVLCVLWSFGGYLARYYRPIMTIPAPVRLKYADPLVQRLRAEPHCTPVSADCVKKADSVDFPVDRPQVSCIDGETLLVGAAHVAHAFSFVLVLLVIIFSLHEVAIDDGLLVTKILLTIVGGVIATLIAGQSMKRILDPPPSDFHTPLVLLGGPPPPPPPPPTQPPPAIDALIAAIKQNRKADVSELLPHALRGASTTDADGTPAIVLAAERAEYKKDDATEIVQQLVKKTPAIVTERDQRGRTALIVAAEQDNHDLAGYLAGYAADEKDFDQIARAVLIALDRNDSGLLDSVRPHFKPTTDSSLVTQARARLALHDAGIPADPQWLVRYVSRHLKEEKGEPRAARTYAELFRQSGFPLTVRDANGSNLLMLAYRWQNPDFAAYLIETHENFCGDPNRFHETLIDAHNRYCSDCRTPPCLQ
jgi:ankyrin repeat protein